MKRFYLFILILALSSISHFSKSQGCSDAGLCSVGALTVFKFEMLPAEKTKLSVAHVEDVQMSPIKIKRPRQDTTGTSSGLGSVNSTDSLPVYKSSRFVMQVNGSYAEGEQHTSIYTTMVEGNLNIVKEKLYLQAKVPYTFIKGNLGTVNGLSDITLSMSFLAFNKVNSNLIFTGGVKIPTNKADISKNNMPLPMVYQTSLGSTDILLGAKYMYRKWDFTLGYQHSFNATNNGYLYKQAINENVVYNGYFESNKMKRADDGIVRVIRNFRIKKAVTSAGLLFIYHLSNDKITNAAGERVEAKGSKGLTLNLNLSGIMPISKNIDFLFIFGSPLVNREYRTDGLTRQFVFITGLKFNLYNW